MIMLCSPARPPVSRRRPGRPRYARPALLVIYVLLLALFTSGPVAGRPVVGKIRGTVHDALNRPLSGLMVQLSSKDDNGVLRVTGTDERGRYLFRDLPAGIYEIVVGANGYMHARKVGIEVRPPFQNLVGFVLQRSTGESVGGGLPGAGAAQDAGGAADGVSVTGLVSTIAPDAITVPVRGLFLNKDRHGIPEVSVTFVGLANGGVYQGLSVEDGRFILDAVPVGSYRVLVSSPGHVALDLPSVEVAEPGGLNLSLSLVDYPLNSRDRLGVVVLPDEKARTLPAAYRFPEKKRSETDSADEAGTGETHADRDAEKATEGNEETTGENSDERPAAPDASPGSGEKSGSG